MKKIALVLGIFAAGFAFAQSNEGKTVYLLDGILSSENYGKNENNNKNIASMEVYKYEKDFPKFLQNSKVSSVINIKTKEQNYDRISLADLNEQFGISKNNPVYFDGNLFTDTSLKITGDSLKEMTATEKDGKKYLFIYSEAQK